MALVEATPIRCAISRSVGGRPRSWIQAWTASSISRCLAVSSCRLATLNLLARYCSCEHTAHLASLSSPLFQQEVQHRLGELARKLIRQRHHAPFDHDVARLRQAAAHVLVLWQGELVLAANQDERGCLDALEAALHLVAVAGQVALLGAVDDLEGVDDEAQQQVRPV